MSVLVIGNAAVDIAFEVDHLPRAGESMLAKGRAVDAGGKGLDWASGLSSTNIGDNLAQESGLFLTENIDKRADLIASEGLITGDKYVFLRSLYLQRREYLVNDGVTADDFDDFDDFDDEEWDDEEWDEDWDKEPAQ